jgi:hypothetical protein
MKITQYTERILSNYFVASILLTGLFVSVFFEKLSTLASILIGSYITWLVSRAYYLKAGKELAEESSNIRDTLRIVALKQQEPGAYQIKIKEDGKITATVEKSASIGGHSKLTGNLQTLEKGQRNNLKNS